MKTTRTHGTTAPLLAALACLATIMPPAHAQDGVIAAMDVDGSNAFVDDARQPPSSKDIRIFDGNLVRTGQDTGANIDIIPQGFVRLRENSAKLISNSFFKGTRCFAVRLIAGELYINGENVCFVTNVGAVSGISHSRINIKVDERGTVLTVIEGMAELEGQPASMQVSASEQLVVLPNGEYFKNTLDPAAAERTAEWTKDYFNASSGKQEKKMSTGAKTALGILGAIILGKAIHEATDDDDDDRRSPPTSPEPDDPEPERSEPPAEDPTPTPTPTPTPSAGSSDAATSRILRRPVEVPLTGCCLPLKNGYGEYGEETTPADCVARGGRLADTGTCTHPVN